MAVESATYIGDLNASNPPGTDVVSEGDNVLRLIKTTLQNTFPSATGVWTALAHTWTATQTFSASGSLAAPVEVISTNADANIGPIISRYRNSASPADGDIGPGDYYYAEDSAGNKDLFAAVRSVLVDITTTTEDGQLDWGVITAGSFAYELSLDGSALFPVTDDGLALGKSATRFGKAWLADLDADGTVTLKGTALSTFVASLLSAANVQAFMSATVGAVSSSTTPTSGNNGRWLVDTAGGAGTWRRLTDIAAVRSLLNTLGTAKGTIAWYDGSNWVGLAPPGVGTWVLSCDSVGTVYWDVP